MSDNMEKLEEISNASIPAELPAMWARVRFPELGRIVIRITYARHVDVSIDSEVLSGSMGPIADTFAILSGDGVRRLRDDVLSDVLALRSI